MSRLDDLKKQAEEMLEEDGELLIDIVNELDSQNGFADGWRGYPMFELEEFYGEMPLKDFMQKIAKGFDVNDDYFIETIYGIESTDDLADYYRDHTTMDEVLDRVLDTPRMYIGNAEFSDLIDEIQEYDEDAENESKTTVGMINKILEGGDIRKVLTTLRESSEKLTWDDICDLADGTAFGDPELKAKDSARAHVGDFAVSRGLPDPEDDEIPEETIEDLCKEYSIRFNDLGEIISFKG